MQLWRIRNKNPHEELGNIAMFGNFQKMKLRSKFCTRETSTTRYFFSQLPLTENSKVAKQKDSQFYWSYSHQVKSLRGQTSGKGNAEMDAKLAEISCSIYVCQGPGNTASHWGFFSVNKKVKWLTLLQEHMYSTFRHLIKWGKVSLPTALFISS